MSAPEAGTTAEPAHADRLAGAVYGQVVATATTLGLSLDDGLGAGRLALVLLATMVVFWIAHVYAELITAAVVHTGRTRAQGARHVVAVLLSEWPVAQAAVPGAIVLGLSAAGLWSRDTAVTLAVALGIAELFGWGLAIGRRHGRTWGRSALLALGSAGLGGVIVLAEVALH